MSSDPYHLFRKVMFMPANNKMVLCIKLIMYRHVFNFVLFIERELDTYITIVHISKKSCDLYNTYVLKSTDYTV